MRIASKIITAFIVIINAVITLFIGYYVCELEEARAYNRIRIYFTDTYEIEYGDSFSSDSLVTSSIGDIIQYPSVNTKKMGEQTLVYKVRYKNMEKEIERSIKIIDTKYPIIELHEQNATVKQGYRYIPEDNIKKVYDEVDGRIEDYTVSHNLNTKEAGTYKIEITAKDINGNETKTSFNVVVK